MKPSHEHRFEYPPIEAHAIVQNYHGTEVSDPYGWLVDLENPTVQTWINDQNQLTDSYLDSKGALKLHEQLKDRTDTYDVGLFKQHGNYYFWKERAPGQKHNVLYRSIRPWDSKARHVVLDPNTAELDEHATILDPQVSPTGKHVLYHLSTDGGEGGSYFIRDVVTGKDTHFIDTSFFHSATWSEDGKNLYYTEYDANAHLPLDPQAEYVQPKIYLHKLTDSDRINDTLIFDGATVAYAEWDSLGKDMYTLEIDKNRVMISYLSTDYDVLIFLVDKELNTTTQLLPGNTQLINVVTCDDYIYALTHDAANNGRILSAPISEAHKPMEDWQEYLGEYPEHVLSDFQVLSKDIDIASYWHYGSSTADIYKKGKFIGELPIPEFSTLESATVDDTGEIYYKICNFLTPGAIYRYNTVNKKSELIWQNEQSLDPNLYETRQEWYTAHDGTEIPMFLVGEKNRDNITATPTLLDVYGGFQVVSYPYYTKEQRAFLEYGGILGVPSVRGGGEFGTDWHDSARAQNKHVSFQDTIDAAEYLIKSGYATPELLAITGTSNGGMTAAYCAVARPDLFQATLANVPVTDLVDFPNQLLGRFWTPEYGDPSNADDFEHLYSLSPYHQIQDNIKYPNMLVTTGLSDNRVHPLHAFKLVARLQKADPESTHLLLADKHSGHIADYGNHNQYLKNAAYRMAFILHHLGVEIGDQGTD